MYNGSRYSGSNYDGSYYNWQVTTAGTGGQYGANRAATGDICPKYWRLPTSAEQDNILSKMDSIGVNAFYSDTDGSIHNPMYPGYFYQSSRTENSLRWWSSTQGDENKACALLTNRWNQITGCHYEKFTGHSVRCLVQAASS